MPISEKDKIPKFDPDVYNNIAMNDLVAYGVYFLSQSVNEIVDTDIVAICFLMFPKRFELRGYPQWPDSTVVNKRWLDCRAKGLLTGSAKDGFKLTPKGLRLANDVQQRLGANAPAKKLKQGLRTRSERFVNEILNSEAYQQFKRDGYDAKISEYDFRGLLLCTLDSLPETLQSNLLQFKDHASNCERDDLVEFLNQMERKFCDLFSESGAGRYRGGMVRQKIK